MPGGIRRWGIVAAVVCSGAALPAAAQVPAQYQPTSPGGYLPPGVTRVQPAAPTQPGIARVQPAAPVTATAPAVTPPAATGNWNPGAAPGTLTGVSPVAPLAPVAPAAPARTAADPKAGEAKPGEHKNGEHHEPKDLTPKELKDDHHEHHEEHHHGPVWGHITPSAPSEGGLFTSADFLLYRARRGAFDYAINSPVREAALGGTTQYLNYELRPGVRANIGYRIPDCGAEVLAGYTYYRSSAAANVAAGPGGVVYPTLTRPGLVAEASAASADANLEYNVFDAEVAQRFALSPHVGVRLAGGFRFVTIRQDFNAFYDGLDARQSQVFTESAFDGFGPTVGTEVTWACWNGFHVYGKAGAGLLTGKTRNPYTETNNAGQTRYVALADETRKVVPTASIGIGAGWQYRSVTVRVGYEITQYFGLIDQPRLTDDITPGKLVRQTADLSLEGLFASFGFAF